jgi:hypothetical protein
MASLHCKDGTVVQISTETEIELRKAFGSKQKLRHGDYGYYMECKTDPCVVCNVDGQLQVVNNYSLCCFTLSKHGHQKFDRRGNIFDDLKK